MVQAKAVIRRADAKKKLTKAAAQTKRTVGAAKKAATKGHKAATGFRATVKAANQEAFHQRLAAVPKPSGPGTEGRVLQAMMAAARAP